MLLTCNTAKILYFHLIFVSGFLCLNNFPSVECEAKYTLQAPLGIKEQTAGNEGTAKKKQGKSPIPANIFLVI